MHITVLEGPTHKNEATVYFIATTNKKMNISFFRHLK